MATFTKQDLNVFESNLRKEIERTDNLPINQKTNDEFLERNLALSLWIIHSLYYAIRHDILIELAGVPNPDNEGKKELSTAAIKILDKWKKFILPDQSRLGMDVYHTEFLDKICAIFNEKCYYNLGGGIEYFQDTDVNQFIAWLNMLDITNKKNSRDIGRLIAKAFTNISSNIKVELPDTQLSRHYAVFHVYHVHAPWHFLFLVYPTLGVVADSEAKEAISLMTYTRDNILMSFKLRIDELPMLLIAPSIGNQSVSDELVKYPYLYHFWSISVPRFFNGLRQLDSPETNQRLSENLIFMFPDESSAKFSATAALERIKKKLTPTTS